MTKLLGRQTLGRCADWLAVSVAVALPWSTSLTGIFVALWIVTLIGSWDIPTRRYEPVTLAGGLPIALWALAAAGMLWANDGGSSLQRIGGLLYEAITQSPSRT
jgi:hypothetical protein